MGDLTAPGRPRVVILGAGLGALFTAPALERAARRGERAVEVSLIGKTNSFLSTPFRPQAAGGTLEPRHVVVPIRGHLPDTTVLMGQVVGHDREARAGAAGGPARAVPYDHLVVSPGSVSRTVPIPGLGEAAVGFTTLAEAIHLRSHALRQLEVAHLPDEPEERAAALTFAFVGGGYAGLESLAELQDLVRDAKPLYRGLAGERARFVLVEAQEAVIPEVGGRLSAYAMRQLAERGIGMRLGTTVTDARGGAVTLATGAHPVPDPGVDRRRATASCGGDARPADRRPGAHRGRDAGGRGASGVWALGDAAAVPDPARPGPPCPLASQHALRQARLAGGNILSAVLEKPARPFRYRALGVFVDLGDNTAVASVRASGSRAFPAWFVTPRLPPVPGLRRPAQGARGGRLDRLPALHARPGRARDARPT